MSLDIIIGPMFSGKSSRILSIVSRYEAIKTPILVIKHSSDTRYEFGHTDVVTHDKRKVPCISVQNLFYEEVMDRIGAYQVIIVDEAQFFDRLVPFVEHVVDTLGKNLYLVGLDGDSNRRRFGELLDCIPLADRVEKISAFCHRCSDGTPGLFSYRRKGPGDQQVIVGGPERYQSLCRKCYLQKVGFTGKS
jgi:thymidine kinase